MTARKKKPKMVKAYLIDETIVKLNFQYGPRTLYVPSQKIALEEYWYESFLYIPQCFTNATSYYVFWDEGVLKDLETIVKAGQKGIKTLDFDTALLEYAAKGQVGKVFKNLKYVKRKSPKRKKKS